MGLLRLAEPGRLLMFIRSRLDKLNPTLVTLTLTRSDLTKVRSDVKCGVVQDDPHRLCFAR